MKITGPFSQILTLSQLPLKGPLQDEQLEILTDSGIATENGKILKVGDWESLKKEFPQADIEEIKGEAVLLPGFTDSHTHICFGGTRAKDFAMRLNGKSYLEIAESGGGIQSSVQSTRKESKEELFQSALERAEGMLKNGITTIEIKSGYGLDKESEIKMLECIQQLKENIEADVIPTFLGAHTRPADFQGDNKAYLDMLLREVLPIVKEKGLSNRVDIFTEQSAFTVEESIPYLKKAKEMGFEITVHADQFTPGAGKMAAELGAVSADHLEFSGEKEIKALAESDTVAVVLPGASLGLGMQFAPARKLLDAGACVSIASDWNPGSAPMGDLLTQASILATFENLSMAEVLAGLTFRAAKALNLEDRGTLEAGKKADFISFPTDDFRQIIYRQGQLKPDKVWVDGKKLD